jgi:hypothetical protein
MLEKAESIQKSVYQEFLKGDSYSKGMFPCITVLDN